MQGMGSHAYSVTNSVVTALFAHSAYVTSAYWIIAVAFVVVLPHLVWLVQNDFVPFTYAEETAALRRGACLSA